MGLRVELLSNLVWGIVALALWGVWLARQGSARHARLSFGIRGQLVALGVLTLILLPVISVSDDLQASHNPAEVERSCIRSDQHLLLPDAPPPAPAPFAAVIPCLLLQTPRATAYLRPPVPPFREQAGCIRDFASRPPPVA